MKKRIKSFAAGFLTAAIVFSGGIAYAAGGTTIEVFYSVKDIIINNVSKMPSTNKPFIYNGATYVPLRFVSENLGFSVDWNDASKSVIISAAGSDAAKSGAAAETGGAPSEPAAQANTVKSLPISNSLKKGMTDAEFNEAYAIASAIAGQYAGMSTEEQLYGVFLDLRYLTDTVLTYSASDPHYSDVYGFFVLNRASCAGATRAVALCLTILGIPYEHVNENQWSHQWCRVDVNGTYWICDAYGMYVGPEPEPYKHPYLE